MNTDTTLFTNEPGSTLLDRFRKTLKDIRYFDILVGLNVNPTAYEVFETVKSQDRFGFESHSMTKSRITQQTISEMDESEDTYKTELGIRKFIEFLTTDCVNKEQDIIKDGNGRKLEFRAYPDENLHVKVYISGSEKR